MRSKKFMITIGLIVSLAMLGYGAYWLYNVVIEDVANKIRIAVSQGVSEGISDGIGNTINPLTLPARIFGTSKR